MSPQTLEGLSINFDKMFSSVRGCAKHIAQSCKLKANVTVEGNEIEHGISCPPCILILVEYLSKFDDVRSV